MNVDLTLEKMSSLIDYSAMILDIGAGKQEHANFFRSRGHTVHCVDFSTSSEYVGDFNTVDIPLQYDVVWCSHCLEHQLNVNQFLLKVNSVIKPHGWLAVTVPPLKHKIVGGHVSLWNAGLLVYNLVLAGFDCQNAKIKSYDYNISVIVQKKTFDMPDLIYDRGDLNTLRNFFPDWPKDRWGHFDGGIAEWNW
jgi:SAM-dependent methyltransferase